MKKLSENTNQLWVGPIVSVLVTVLGFITETDILTFLGSGAGIATIVPIIIEYIKANVWDWSGKKFLKYPVSRWATWVLSFLLCGIAYQLGAIQTFGLLYGIIYALLVGGAANRYYHWSDIEFILAIWAGRTEKAQKLREEAEAEKE
jgi:uncharacterized Tic20 family protein